MVRMPVSMAAFLTLVILGLASSVCGASGASSVLSSTQNRRSMVLGFQMGVLPSGFPNARRRESVVKMSAAPRTLTSDEMATYNRDGVVLVRGMLQGTVLEEAIAAAAAVVQNTEQRTGSGYRAVTVLALTLHLSLLTSHPSPLTSHPSPLTPHRSKLNTKHQTSTLNQLSFQGWRSNSAMRHVAMDSASPSIAAQVMLHQEGVGEDEIKGFCSSNTTCFLHASPHTRLSLPLRRMVSIPDNPGREPVSRESNASFSHRSPFSPSDDAGDTPTYRPAAQASSLRLRLLLIVFVLAGPVVMFLSVL